MFLTLTAVLVALFIPRGNASSAQVCIPSHPNPSLIPNPNPTRNLASKGLLCCVVLFVLCYVVLCCLALSCLLSLVSCLVMSLVLSCLLSSLTFSSLLFSSLLFSSLILSYLISSHLILSYRILCCLALSCLAFSCPVFLSCHVMSCLFLSLVFCVVLCCLLLCCLVLCCLASWIVFTIRMFTAFALFSLLRHGTTKQTARPPMNPPITSPRSLNLTEEQKKITRKFGSLKCGVTCAAEKVAKFGNGAG